MDSLTEAQVLEELRAAFNLMPDNAEGLATAEIAEALSIDHRTAQKKMARLVKAGRARCNGYRFSTSMNGSRCRTPVYQLIA